ncbi:MAG: J domain-containing protein [Spirochaetota bacterium]
MKTKTHYQVLNVRATASQSEIRSAFQRLALTHHPDVSKHPNAVDIFRDVLEAYNTLSREHTRFAYDIALDRIPSYSFENAHTRRDGIGNKLKTMFSFMK